MKQGVMLFLVALFFALLAVSAVARVCLVCDPDHHQPTMVQLSADGEQEGQALMIAWQQAQTLLEGESGAPGRGGSPAMVQISREAPTTGIR